MKPIFPALALAVAGLLAAPSAAFAWERIATEQQYLDRIAGQTQVDADGNRVVHHADGRITGTWAGQPLVGRWQWHQGFWCRNVRVGNNPETGTDCQVMEIRANQVRNTRNQGRGESGVFTIQ